MTSPPPVRDRISSVGVDYGNAVRAIETVRDALKYMEIGIPIIHRGPRGEVHVDVPLMYHGYALDRIHYDPYVNTLSPKGRPVRARGVEVKEDHVREVMEKVLRELRVIDAVEFREPENAWIVPLAWNHIIIAHIKVSYNGNELIPGYGLTGEVRRYAI